MKSLPQVIAWFRGEHRNLLGRRASTGTYAAVALGAAACIIAGLGAAALSNGGTLTSTAAGGISIEVSTNPRGYIVAGIAFVLLWLWHRWFDATEYAADVMDALSEGEPMREADEYATPAITRRGGLRHAYTGETVRIDDIPYVDEAWDARTAATMNDERGIVS